jgi:tetratricopeptide (TPR) repeat protein
LPGSPRPEETEAARFADGLLEAGWLLCLLVVPVFFDVWSRHPFEPDKAMVVRLLALLVAAAGLARALESWRSWRWPAGAPLLGPVLLFFAAAAASTALSIAPRLSLWGSDARGEGLVTLASYLAVFAALAARLRRREQLDRAIDVIVAGSVPVTLYGIAQAVGLDPIQWKLTYEPWRIASTLGNPVFAGSYLILALPVTLGAALELRERATSPGAPWRRLRQALYTSAASLQVAALVLTGSRGPWVGGAAGLVAFVLLDAALRRRRTVAGAALTLAGAGLAFVSLLNLPGGPLESARQSRLLGRLGHLYDTQGVYNPGDRARVRVWEGALALARPRPPLAFSEGEDPRGALRPFVGYGPETLQAAFGAVYDAEFASLERRNPDVSDYGISTFNTRVPDRSHNELLDSLVTGGLLGAAAHLALAAAIQVFGLRALGLLATRRDLRQLAMFGLGGGALGVLAAAAAPSWGFLGLSLPLGLVAGWMAYVLARAFRADGGDVARSSPLQVALLAALIGHFVDIQLGPLVVTGRLYFWALTGLLVALPAIRPDEAGTTASPHGEPPPPSRWRRLTAPAGLLAAALAITLVFDFVGVAARPTGGTGAQRASFAAGAAGVLVLVLLEAGRRSGRRGPFVVAALAVAAALALVFDGLHFAALTPAEESRKVADLAWDLGGVFRRYALWLLALAALLGAALARPGAPVARNVALRSALRTAAVLALAIAVAVPPALASVGADIIVNFAGTLQGKGLLVDSLGLFDRAAEMAPWEAANFRAQGEAYLTTSRRTGSPLRRQEYLGRAQTALTRAEQLDPLLPDNHANLARLAKWRADLSSRTPDVARREMEEAVRHFAAAARLVPANTLLLNEWAELDFSRRRDFAAAEEKLQRSLRMDPGFDYTYAALGDMHMARAKAGVGDPSEDYRQAAAAYGRAWVLRKSLKAAVNKAVAHERLGETEAAIEAYNNALEMHPPMNTSWAYHERLAALHLGLGQRPAAERQARLALSDVPAIEKPKLLERLSAAGLGPAE